MTLTRHSWDYPDCPDCEIATYVGRYNGVEDWHCLKCDRRFDG